MGDEKNGFGGGGNPLWEWSWERYRAQKAKRKKGLPKKVKWSLHVAEKTSSPGGVGCLVNSRNNTPLGGALLHTSRAVGTVADKKIGRKSHGGEVRDPMSPRIIQNIEMQNYSDSQKRAQT